MMESSMAKEIRKNQETVKRCMAAAKDSVKRNPEDDTDATFLKLQVLTIKLVENLKEVGCLQHFEWSNLLAQACELMEPLVRAQPFMVSFEVFSIRTTNLLEKQTGLKNLSRVMARKLLCEGKHFQAVQAALFSLRFSIDVNGLDSVELVPAYLILSEASIGLNKLKQADEYLAHAEWTILKSNDSTNAIKSKLYRNIGVLHATKGDYESAQRIFSEDVYHGSLEWGPDHVQTTGGYFHMANVFFRLNKMDVADSLYSQVTENWFKYLVDAVNARIAANSNVSVLSKSRKQKTDHQPVFDKELEMEGSRMLNSVYEIRDQSPKPNFEQFATICFDLAMFHYLMCNNEQSKDFYKKGKIQASKVTGGFNKNLPKLFETTPNPSGDAV